MMLVYRVLRRQTEARAVDSRELRPWFLFHVQSQRQLGSQISMFQVFCEIG